MNSPITSYLQAYRQWTAKLRIVNSGVQFVKFCLPLLTLIILMEAIFYNSIQVRSHLMAYLLGGIFNASAGRNKLNHLLHLNGICVVILHDVHDSFAIAVRRSVERIDQG